MSNSTPARISSWPPPSQTTDQISIAVRKVMREFNEGIPVPMEAVVFLVAEELKPEMTERIFTMQKIRDHLRCDDGFDVLLVKKSSGQYPLNPLRKVK